MSPEFVAVDRVRWEQVALPIDGIEDDAALFGRLEALVDDLVTRSDDWHVVYRVRLEGRGSVHESLARAGSVDDLIGQLNQTWASRQPFAFCGGIVDNTKSRLDRAALAESKDFIGDFLALTEMASRYDSLVAELQQALVPLYDNTRARQYLGDGVPDTAEVRELVTGAEDVALGLLVDESEASPEGDADADTDEAGD